MFTLSHFGKKSSHPSPVNAMTAAFAHNFREGIDINLGVGYVNNTSIPQEKLLACFEQVLQLPHIYRNPLNYGAAAGSPNLQEAIRHYYIDTKILQSTDFEDKSIIIGANGATSILDALADVLPTGIVITADPMYYIYTETLERKGFTILAIPEDEHGIDVAMLREKLKNVSPQKISFFYIVTINNPSTTQTNNARKQEIVQLAAELSAQRGNKIPVVFDKAYEDLIYGENCEISQSPLLYDELGLVLEIGTLSKIIAPALRIGYAICKKSELSTVLIQRMSDIGFSAPLINQEIASCFLQNYIHEHRARVLETYRHKAQFVQQLIYKHLAPYIEQLDGGQASFYYYITTKNTETHTQSDFYKFLTRHTGNASTPLSNRKKSSFGLRPRRILRTPTRFYDRKRAAAIANFIRI
ncbi:MAG: pyridoxal phosphate-dependent aminotransferase [Bacteroidetes bacterium]|nr:pyridoxal phosphate-dependent aminotransferase [Bacteroidota bacterium]